MFSVPAAATEDAGEDWRFRRGVRQSRPVERPAPRKLDPSLDHQWQARVQAVAPSGGIISVLKV